MTKRAFGDAGEDFAVSFLTDKGYEIVERNFVYKHCEIDIIARQGEDLVFIEVRTRRRPEFESPLESVTPQKQQRIRKAAEGYYWQHKIDNQSCRFDVVAVTVTNGVAKAELIQNAF